MDAGIGEAEEYIVLLQDGKLVQYGVLTLGVHNIFGLWQAIEEAPTKAYQ